MRDLDADARVAADQLVFQRQYEWRSIWRVDMLKLRNLIAQEMIDHAEVCVRASIDAARGDGG